LQIRAGDRRDQAGDRLTMNLHYIEEARESGYCKARRH
jgi:hypothetical protein